MGLPGDADDCQAAEQYFIIFCRYLFPDLRLFIFLLGKISKLKEMFTLKKLLTLGIIFSLLILISAPTKLHAEESNYVTPQMYGAVGNGIKDDTEAIQSALNSGKDLFLPDGNYRITKDIKVSNNISITGENAALHSSGAARLNIGSSVSEITISNMVFDGVAIVSSDRTNGIRLSGNFNNFHMKNTAIYGILISDIEQLMIDNCSFSYIGTSKINPTYQGIGVRVNRGVNVTVKNSLFEQCRGTGGLVLRYTQILNVYQNDFLKNDYRGIVVTNENDYSFSTTGVIEANNIQDCGVYASHRTGVGCNGIYAHGNLNGVSVLNNEIRNVAENGIEGTFGLVEGNLVDGTGVDQVNHPTPSASGINMYGKVYRNNTVRNTYLPAFYVYDNSKLDGTGIHDLVVEGNIVENSDLSGSQGYAIYPNASSYSNVKISGNTTDKPLYVRTKATFNNVSITGNLSSNGNFFPLANKVGFYITYEGSSL